MTRAVSGLSSKVSALYTWLYYDEALALMNMVTAANPQMTFEFRHDVEDDMWSIVRITEDANT